jgi:actin-related protein 9
VNLQAFQFFLKLLYRSLIQDRPDVSNIPLVLISSSLWSKLDQEYITQYVFEEIGIGAFTILPSALGALYAYGGLQTSVVIDIGAEKTEIVPIVDFSIIHSAEKVLPFGGDYINEALQKSLPQLSASQIEDLKKSEIYEVLSDEEKKKSFFGLAGLNKDNDEFDVAAIVASGRAREILEEREKQDQEKVPNAQLENNTFVDSTGNQITVGKERFKGCEDLISKISTLLRQSLNKIADLSKRQEAWNHIIIVGRTSRIIGFNEALNTQVVDDHLIGKDIQQTNAIQAAFQATAQTSQQFTQVPNSIRFTKMPDYFPEWKKTGYSDVQFLGAQIVARQIFTTQNESMYLTRTIYSENGPTAIWDLAY